MRLGRVAYEELAGVIAALLVCAAQGQYRPEVPVLQCAHEGEPVPGVPGATFDYLWPPGIDAAGNVLFSGYMAGAGITSANDEGLWFGQPGAGMLVARDGWAAPNLPGVVYSSVSQVGEAVSETGWIVFTAYLSGAGVTPGVNNRAVFCGPPGDFRLVIRTGAPAPQLGPNIVISGTEAMWANISDNGTLLVGAALAGSGLPPTYDHAYWVGPRDALQLAAFDGMPVQGCPECQAGVYFQTVGSFSFNDAGQVAFDGGLAGPGIHWYDSKGHWLGAPGALTMTLRAMQLVPEFGPSVRILEPCGGLHALNSFGDKVERIRVFGGDVTANNEWAIVGGETDPAAIIAREGDPRPEAGEGRYITGLGNPFINDLRQVLYFVVYDSDTCGVYFGPYADPRLILLDGAPADYLPLGTVFYRVSAMGDGAAMNDVGDLIGLAQTWNAGGDILDTLLLWRGLTLHYIPLVQTGALLFGRTLTLADWYGDYQMETGGGDGLPQSFNDRRQMAMLLDFTDGTSGIYRIGPPLLGDTDGDGQVGPPELISWASCAAGPGGSVGPGCEPLDLNLDGAVDLRDLGLLQAMIGEER